MTSKRPPPRIGQRWRLDGREGAIDAILPGGSGDEGIVVFADTLPPAHTATMRAFGAWQFVSEPHIRPMPALDCGDGPPVLA